MSFSSQHQTDVWEKVDADIKARAREAVRARHAIGVRRLATHHADFNKAVRNALGDTALFAPLAEIKRRVSEKLDLDHARERHYRRGFDPGEHMALQHLRDAISQRIARGEA